MKIPLFLLYLTSLLLLVGCTNNKASTPSPLGIIPYDCSTSGYYENVIIPNKTLSYEYDEITNSFFITIPELCVTLRSTVLEQLQISKEDYLAKGDEIFVETNVSQIKAEKAKGIIISNNTISIGNPRNTGYITNAITFYNKPANQSIEKLLREKYSISNMHCILESNVNNVLFPSDWYRFITSGASIGRECGDYPFIEGNFDSYHPYMIRYDKKFPTRYLLKEPNISGGFDIGGQLNIEFIE